MRVLETDNWSLLLPREWAAERDEDVVVIGDEDGVGCLEISELRRERGAFNTADLEALAAEGMQAPQSLTVAGLAARYAAFSEEGAALREWYVLAGTSILYITYSCDLDNRGMDDAVVDEILGTLRVAAD